MKSNAPKYLGCDVSEETYWKFKQVCAREGLKQKEVLAQLVLGWVGGGIALPKAATKES
jgi:hypothetical protein